jgi:hypothetical protein
VKLLINDNPVDIQLQGEATAFEVIKQLDGWLSEQGHAMIGLSINGSPVELSQSAWRQTALETIDTMNIEAPNLHQLRLANLAALNHYAESLNTALVELSNGQHTLPSILQLIKVYPDIRPSLNYLSENIGTVPAEDDPIALETDAIIQSCHAIDALAVLSRDRIGEASQPTREARTTASILMEIMPRLGMVSTNILTGKAKEAYDTILQFSELLSKLLRLFWLMVETKTPGQEAPYSRDELQQWAMLINQCLDQVSVALDSQDTVLLGDLLEYELPQHIEKLVSLIPVED